MASRLYEILRKDVFSDIETGPWWPLSAYSRWRYWITWGWRRFLALILTQVSQQWLSKQTQQTLNNTKCLITQTCMGKAGTNGLCNAVLVRDWHLSYSRLNYWPRKLLGYLTTESPYIRQVMLKGSRRLPSSCQQLLNSRLKARSARHGMVGVSVITIHWNLSHLHSRTALITNPASSGLTRWPMGDNTIVPHYWLISTGSLGNELFPDPVLTRCCIYILIWCCYKHIFYVSRGFKWKLCYHRREGL